MRRYSLIVVACLCAPGFARAFEEEVGQVQSQIQSANRQRNQQERDRLAAAIVAQTQAVSALNASIADLARRTQDARDHIMGPEPAVSAAAQQLLAILNDSVRNVQNAATAVARLAFGVGRDDTLADPASRLQDEAFKAMTASENAADQICVTIVDPLRQRKMYEEAQPLATSAPSLADGGDRLGEEAARLYDAVSGQPGAPIHDPSRPRRNLCDNTRPWPLPDRP